MKTKSRDDGEGRRYNGKNTLSVRLFLTIHAAQPLLTDGTMFTYPWGTSPVFYIGKADSLRKRLSDHQKYTKSAIEDHNEKNGGQGINMALHSV